MSDLEGLRILVAEDDSGLLEVLVMILEQAGARVHGAEDGRRALEMLGDHEVDLILSDIQMPRMDGLALLDAVRARNPDKPSLLFLTGQAPLTEAEAVERGAAGLIEKPPLFDELVYRIKHLDLRT